MVIINSKKIIRSAQAWLMAAALLLSYEVGFAQNEGALFMLSDNFQAQILNPSFFNDEEAILALPGVGGLSLSNKGNFRMTDVVYTKPAGQTVYDLTRFSEKGSSITRNSIQLSIPLLYLGIPVRDGMISFYAQERANTLVSFPINSIVWLNNGNLPDEYRDFHSGDISARLLGFHELALGYARKLNDKLSYGVRGKLLFGEMYIQVNDWNFNLETSPDGDKVLLTSRGNGQASIPFPVTLDNRGKYKNIEVNHFFANYFSVRNPGLAFDGGITIDIDEKKQFSASLLDLGLIYFYDNSWDFYQNDAYEYHGLDISNSTNSKLGTEGYILPYYLMTSVRDTIKNVYKPIFNSRLLFRGPAPQIFLHYQNKYTESFTYGITNHTVLQRAYLINTLSLSAMKKVKGFSFVGDISLHELSSLTVGGGFQWNLSFAQLFVFTDNLLAIYHPAAQKSYALTFGLNFLIKEANQNRNDNSRKGTFSKYFPFYKKYQ